MVEQATGEVRFAVVLYGGVSLAIYMNGIAQELLRMVRGSSDLPDEELAPGEMIYRRLSRELAGPRGGRKRFVIDIISGTSAGGINGVALAKALVVGSRDMAVLREAWTDKADIGLLLNDRTARAARLRPTESLLDGGHMYGVLHETIARIKGDGKPLSEMVDLFVTATDLQGVPAPIHLTGARLDEKIHKTVFHFAYDGGREGRNDFSPENDAMLAFAARCTSSFPVAFPPMRFVDMPADARRADYARFFPRGWPHEQRLFADGGYLDNRPFSHAIDLIPFRPTTLPGERKLLFIDPFPEERRPPDPVTGVAPPPPPEPVDFLQNARLAASTLPRTEVIRDDIRAITRMNARLERLGTLQARWARDQRQAAMRGQAMDEPTKPENLDLLDLADQMERGYGSSYPLYHHLRVYDTSDSLTGIVARLAGYAPDSDEALYLRQILRAWRDDHFSAYHQPGRETESAFLSRYDIGFRLRRLIHLRAEIDRRLDPGPDAPLPPDSAQMLRAARLLVENELAAVRRLATPLEADAETLLNRDEIAGLTHEIGRHYGEAMQQPTLQNRYELARQVYEKPAIRPLVDRALAQLGVDMRQAFDQGSARIREGLDLLRLPALQQVYDGFHWHDVMTYPFLEGSELQEHSQVEVFRISPADSMLNGRPAKLAGIAVGAFGGFLNRDWREHDILWGRLDGAERIIAALMPDRSPEARKTWTEALHNQILAEEYGDQAGEGRRLALLKAKLRDSGIDEDAFEETAARALGVKDAAALDLDRFRAHYSAFKPLGPRAPQIAGWSSRSMAILSRMIDDLPDDGILRILGSRAAAALRAGGGLISGFARFAMPGSYWRMLADKMLYLAMLAGLAIGLLGFWLGSGIARAGWALLAAAVALWLLLYLFGRWLRGRASLSQALRWLLGLVALALMGVGAGTVANYLLG
ncbi:patatin-like protein [Paracoccus simplex]|uniref:Patatin-like protein n=1 Tax=Paracoccus simplex TaxID=2086346 RepID=A0ABV7RT14_9RHOB